jgi:hypothetical protein
VGAALAARFVRLEVVHRALPAGVLIVSPQGNTSSRANAVGYRWGDQGSTIFQ